MEESEMSKGQGTECPEISVVIASVNGPDYVDACLKSLRGQTFKGPAEVIVADCCGDGVTELIRRDYPEVTLLSFGSRKTIPELRAIGMKNARGKIIALTEDHCVADPTWFEGMYRPIRPTTARSEVPSRTTRALKGRSIGQFTFVNTANI